MILHGDAVFSHRTLIKIKIIFNKNLLSWRIRAVRETLIKIYSRLMHFLFIIPLYNRAVTKIIIIMDDFLVIMVDHYHVRASRS